MEGINTGCQTITFLTDLCERKKTLSSAVDEVLGLRPEKSQVMLIPPPQFILINVVDMLGYNIFNYILHQWLITHPEWFSPLSLCVLGRFETWILFQSALPGEHNPGLPWRPEGSQTVAREKPILAEQANLDQLVHSMYLTQEILTEAMQAVAWKAKG